VGLEHLAQASRRQVTYMLRCELQEAAAMGAPTVEQLQLASVLIFRVGVGVFVNSLTKLCL